MNNYTVTVMDFDHIVNLIGFDKTDKGYYKVEDDYIISLVSFNYNNGWKIVNCPAFAFVINREFNQNDKKELANYIGKVSINTPKIPVFPKNSVVFVCMPELVKKNTKVDLDGYVINAYSKTLEFLKTKLYTQLAYCPFCKKDRYDTQTGEVQNLQIESVYNVFTYIHPECKENLKNEMLNDINANEKNYKALPLSIILAIVGGAVGFIPTLLTIYLLGSYFGILFALIPVCAMFGYKLGGGPRNKVMVITSVLVTFLVITGFLAFIILTNKLAYDQGLIEDGTTFTTYLTSCLPSFALLYVFGGVGVFISWSAITKSKKEELNRM